MIAVFAGRTGSRRWLFGVCGRLQRLTGINATIFRISFLLSAYFYTVSALLLFALLVVIMRARGEPVGDGPADTVPDPDVTLQEDIKALHLRLAQFETDALSKDRLTARRFKEAGF